MNKEDPRYQTEWRKYGGDIPWGEPVPDPEHHWRTLFFGLLVLYVLTVIFLVGPMHHVAQTCGGLC